MKIVGFLVVAAALPAALAADETPKPPRVMRFEHRVPPGAPLPPHAPHAPLPLEDVVFLRAHEGVELRTVKGAPYTAEAVNESVQVLADGNRIVRRTTSTVARDGEGRTRREQDAGFGLPGAAPTGHRTAFLNDPVAKTRYVLDLEERTAHRLDLPPFALDHATPTVPGAPMEFEFERKVVVRVPKPPAPPDAPAPPAAPEAPAPPAPPDAPAPPAPVVREFHMRVPPPAAEGREAQVEKLGTRTIEGVEAEGTRSVTVIPAGEIGNERALEIVSERWYSPQLQAVVMSRHADPRFGETTYRLTGIALGEPDKSLFEVPSDFEIEDKPGPGLIHIRRR